MIKPIAKLSFQKTALKSLLLFMVFLCSFVGANAATYNVSNGNNSGAGSLRQAILDANANAGADVINFTFSSATTITVTSLLPVITGPVAINGYSAPNSAQGVIGSRTILVTLNGGNTTSLTGRQAGYNSDGLIYFAAGSSGSSISGLSIINTGVGVEAILVEAGVSNIHIWGNYIGVNASGNTVAGSPNRDDGIVIGDYDNTTGSISNVFIGTNGNGTNDANEGNVIANSSDPTDGGDGIQINTGGASFTFSNIKISGNYIGVAADGVTAAPNGILTLGTNATKGAQGVNIRENTSNILVGTNGDGVSDVLERNIISGNYSNGIDVADGSNNINIAGNYIGTDVNGTAAIPNGNSSATSGSAYSGILVINSTNVIIGFNDATMAASVAANARNLISGNFGSAVTFLNGSGLGNKVSGNYIGTTVTGNAALSNGSATLDPSTGNRNSAIGLANASNVLIGTDADGDDDVLERNIIASIVNGYGVNIRSVSSTNNILAGNYIGVGANGTTALGNARGGVMIQGTGSNNNRIGSNDDGVNDATEANVIANNGTSSTTALQRSGVTVLGDVNGNRFSRNIYYNNIGLPIDLLDNTVTTNDGITSASNPNLLLDYPVITNYSLSGTTMTVAGYISTCNGNEATAGSSITGSKRIQFYKVSDDGDQNGALTNGTCTRVVSHGEGVQYLGSITGVTNAFSTSFTLVAGATFSSSDKITAITIDANGNTSEFGVTTLNTITGNIFNDPNAGFVDNSTGSTNVIPNNIYASLIDTSGNVVQSVLVPTGGLYIFSAVGVGTYTVVISTTAGVQGNPAPASILPNTLEHTGDFNGTPNTGNTNATFGTSTSFTVASTDVSNINFGIRCIANPAGADGSTSVCDNNTATITLANVITGEQTGGTWTRLTGTGGTFTAASGTYVPAAGATTSTFRYILTGTAPCPNDTSIATVTITPQANAGTDGSTSVCDNSTATITLASLITGEQAGGTWTRVTGTGGTFTAASGTYVPAVGATTSTFRYIITGTAPCANDTAVATVTITARPIAGADGSTSVCDNNTATITLANVITGEQSGGTWTRLTGAGGTFTAASGTYVPAAGATTSTFRYILTGTAPCPNDTSIATVTITPQANAGTDGSTSVCDNSTATITLASLITGEQAGGIWTRVTGTGGTFTAASGTYVPAVGATTSTFRYVVLGTAPCPNDTSVVTVNITARPIAGTDGNTTICDYSTTTINLAALITGEQTGGTWTRLTGAGGTFTAASGTYVPAVGATTSTFRYILTGTAPCPNDTSVATVNINVCYFNVTGTVFNDINSNTRIDSLEQGTTIGNNLYVYLVNSSNVIVDSAKVNANGTYTLAAQGNQDYTIKLSTVQYTIGNSPAINTTPPTGWVNSGENGAGNTGSGDGTSNGILPIRVDTSAVAQQNFGIKIT